MPKEDNNLVLLDRMIKKMDEMIAVSQGHREKALALKARLANESSSSRGAWQELGHDLANPVESIGKLVDTYNEAVEAVDDENAAWEQALQAQKEALAAQKESYGQ